MTVECVQVVNHPLAQAALSLLRNAETPPDLFRAAAKRLGTLLFTEATRDLPSQEVHLKTPLQPATGLQLAGEIWLCPILRAGLGMLESCLELFPGAHVGFLGLYRDEKTLEPHWYYQNLPERFADGAQVFLLDPMLATGGSIKAALEILLSRGASRPVVLSFIAAPEGIRKVHEAFPLVTIYTGAVDEQLNSRGYILPGLGDAGDRLYGT